MVFEKMCYGLALKRAPQVMMFRCPLYVGGMPICHIMKFYSSNLTTNFRKFGLCGYIEGKSITRGGYRTGSLSMRPLFFNWLENGSHAFSRSLPRKEAIRARPDVAQKSSARS